MGLQVAPGYISQTGYNHPAELFRNITKAIWGRSGLSRPGSFVIAPTGVAQQVSISAGQAVLLGTENASQGAYVAWSDASENKNFAAPSGSPRIDTLLLRVEDPQYGTIPGTPGAYWDIVQGVPAGSPAIRADSEFNSGGGFYIPGAWFRAADVRINPGDTVIPGGQITPNLRYVRGANKLHLAKLADTISDGSYGDLRRNSDTDLLHWQDSSGRWRHVPGQLLSETVVSSGDASIAAGAAQMIHVVTLNDFVQGQKYLVEWEGRATTSVATNAALITLKAASGATVTTAAADYSPVRGFGVPVANTYYYYRVSGMFVPTSSGQWTTGMAYNFFSGSGTATVARNVNDTSVLRVYTSN
jgi:hypothetical protein